CFFIAIMGVVNKEKIKAFFDRLASSWDDDMVIDEKIINTILDISRVTKGSDVLDVACGTGVMIPFYLQREVGSITAIDFSAKMCAIADSKFKDGKVQVICADAETFDNNGRYDAIIIYNAFPHFPDGDKLISHLSILLNKDGILTIAHGMSRDKINSHHINVSTDLKRELPEAEKLASLFAPYLEVTDIISDERMYLVSGRKQ
ncbi:MAG: methyltransferase domain-containing protein, partial [Erysipelotrichaceae bacterium]|nr:methyltransferase domain-containing protein [Erysipelotrichaceae bacterium]